MLSPILAGIVYIRFRKHALHFACWLVSYTGIWFWVITSPDIRFGYHYLLPCIFLPLLTYAESVTHQLRGYVLPMAVSLVCVYYGFLAIRMLQPYSLSQYIVYPLKSPVYFRGNDLHTFRYVMLNDSIKLYIHDGNHHSINAPLPSCSPYHAGIRMRGDKLANGFKTVR